MQYTKHIRSLCTNVLAFKLQKDKRENFLVYCSRALQEYSRKSTAFFNKIMSSHQAKIKPKM